MSTSLLTRSGASVPQAPIEKLQGTLIGRLLRPGAPGYDVARSVWNAYVDKHPGLIAQCAGVDDVVHAVRFAREHDVEVSVRGGGHSIAGACLVDGGLTIDLSPMRTVEVDTEALTARVQAGCKLGDVDRRTSQLGLATTLGIATDTGVAGLTLGGGYGWLAGKFGMACDNVRSAQVVTADGDVLAVSEEQEPDLYWAIRGGGGNFGIVTSFEFVLHPVEQVVGGMVIYPRSPSVIRAFDELARQAPDELSVVGLCATAPDGSPAFAIVCCHCGSADRALEDLAPLRTIAEPLADMIEPRPYVEMQTITDQAWPPGRLYYWKSSLVRRLEAGLIETLIDRGESMPKPYSVMYMQQLHGAATRVDERHTAFAHRFDHYNLGAMLETDDPGIVEEGIEWSRRTWRAFTPYVERSSYVNDHGNDDEDRVRDAYGVNYDRLAGIKQKLDPTNFFHLNCNVRPKSS